MSSLLSGDAFYRTPSSQTTAAYEQSFANPLRTAILLVVRFARAPMSARELTEATGAEFIFTDLGSLRRACVVSATRVKPAEKRHHMVYEMTTDQIELFDLYFEAIGGSSRTPSRKVISSALADEGRRTILSLLAWQDSLTVSELIGLTLLPQPTISGHVDALSTAGLVAVKKDGARRICTLTANAVDAVIAQLEELTELRAAAKRLFRIESVVSV